MRLVTFERFGEERIGFIHEEMVFDLTLCYAALLRKEGVAVAMRVANALIPPDMLKFLEGEEKALEEAERVRSSLRKGRERLRDRVVRKLHGLSAK